MAGGYRAALVRRQLTPGLISSLPGTAGLPPFISLSTSYPELHSACTLPCDVPTSFRGRHRKDHFSPMMGKKFESFRIGERIEFPNESDNLPDLVIGKKIAPAEHRGVSDSVLHDPEHFVVGI